MQFKIMNMFNIIVQHTIKIFKYPPPCRQMCPLHVCSTNYTTNLCDCSNVSLNLDASLSHSCYGCTWNSKIACTINKKPPKINKQFTISPLPHTHIIIYCIQLNSACCISIDSVNKS